MALTVPHPTHPARDVCAITLQPRGSRPVAVPRTERLYAAIGARGLPLRSGTASHREVGGASYPLCADDSRSLTKSRPVGVIAA